METGKMKQTVKGKRWLVAIDGSTHSEGALNLAIERMDKSEDIIFLLTVVPEERVGFSYIGAPLIATELMHEMQDINDRKGKLLLNRMATYLRNKKVEHYKLIFSISNEAGDVIVKAIDKHKIDYCCVGRRGLGKLKRIFVGSVSSYLLQHANCDVMVVKESHSQESSSDGASQHEIQNGLKNKIENSPNIDSSKDEEHMENLKHDDQN
jgi:nucleotide-binding universal stress UspA family protein